MSLVLVLGGQKAGKSSHAAAVAAASGAEVVVITPARADDPELAERIERHRADRPTAWRTVERFDLGPTLAELHPDATVVVDALDTWLAETMARAGLFTDQQVAPLGPAGRASSAMLLDEVTRVAALAAARPGTTIVVAGQPGLGPHPMGASTRRYVDLHGLALQRLAARADAVRWVVAGRALELPAGPPQAPHAPPMHPAPTTWTDRAAPAITVPTGATAGGELTALLEALHADDVDAEARAAALARLEAHLAALAVPPGALGRLTPLARRLASATATSRPSVPCRPALLVAAGDHGVHARGVGPWPQVVSTAVARLLGEGRAGASPAATEAGARTVVLDVGLATPPAAHPRVIAAPVRRGTRDLADGDALSHDEVVRAVVTGARTTHALVDDGADLLVTGDVGITNTTASAALVALCTGADAGAVTGPGAGVDATQLAAKVAVVARCVDRVSGRDPLGLLAGTGGAEHAALVGAMLAGAARGVPVLLDGLITLSAALVADRLAPRVRDALIATHRSPEPGAAVALDRLGLEAPLELGLRLGEGSGALLAVPLLRTAARLAHQVARLEELDLPGDAAEAPPASD